MQMALMEQGEKIWEQVDNIRRKIEILKKTMLVIKTSVTFDGFISRLDTVEERISELESMMETSKSEKQRKNLGKKKKKPVTEYPRTMG